MDKEYRIKKMTEAWEILKEEFSKDISERSEKNLDQATYLIHSYAEKHELPPHPFLEDEEYGFDDIIPFNVDFDSETVLKYAEKMLSEAKKNEEAQTPKNVVEFKRILPESNDDIFSPDIEEIKIKLKDILDDIVDVPPIPEIIESLSNVIAGKGDRERLRRTLKEVFYVVDHPEGPRCRGFFNNVFSKRLWSSFNMLQKKWLIKNHFLSEEATSILKEEKIQEKC